MSVGLRPDAPDHRPGASLSSAQFPHLKEEEAELPVGLLGPKLLQDGTHPTPPWSQSELLRIPGQGTDGRARPLQDSEPGPRLQARGWVHAEQTEDP